jgi:hypothetical protein
MTSRSLASALVVFGLSVTLLPTHAYAQASEVTLTATSVNVQEPGSRSGFALTMVHRRGT